ncbi:E3 ubiquitin-protein ligase TRIM39-like [Odontesthes bonariensis]|uniref:E3 ubiquitin-protein ligase TRIM39-like n=1 Tax=Odontesthes bonariensis TaxID=219752 RepID=UPI003F58752C
MASLSYFSERDISCPICHDIFKDPVLLSCSHSFCKCCLQSWWAKKQTKECVVCKRRSSRGEPPSNLVLKNLCEVFLRERGQTDSESLCSLHIEKLKLFCLNHQQPVCVVCRDSEKHTDHGFRPVDEAAKDHRRKLRELLGPLQVRLKLLHQVKADCDLSAKHIKAQTQHVEKQIRDQFKKLHGFLDEDEEARISALREEEKQKSRVMEKKVEVLSREMAALLEAVRATEEVLQAADVSFLQSYKTTVERVQRQHSPSHESPPVSGTLLDVAKHVGNLSFNVWRKMRKIISYAPVILDPNTANPELIVSEDLRAVRWGRTQLCPDNPERMRHLSCVLGSEGFSGGTHSWDVEVGDNEYWELGVLAESVQMKDNVASGLWRIRFYSGRFRACSQCELDIDVHVKKKFQRIRVHLNWEKGTLSFCDADAGTHIHTFTSSFTEGLLPYFNSVNNHLLKVLPVKISVNME